MTPDWRARYEENSSLRETVHRNESLKGLVS